MFNRFFKFKTDVVSDDPIKEYCKTGKKSDIVMINALEVTDFSSQYGSETSISYTACNLAGKSNIYPSYGDFTQACVFRTYGPWWDNVPSSRQHFKRTPPSFVSQDYIELSFQTKLYPIKLEIYETYNPGCVVRILACERSDDTDVDTGHKLNRWKTLWEGEPILPGLTSRMFCPPLKHCPFQTNLIRLELCHTLVHYYTELDSVVLYGSKVDTVPELGTMVDTQCTVTDKAGNHKTQVSAMSLAFGDLSIKSFSQSKDSITSNKQESNQSEDKELKSGSDSVGQIEDKPIDGQISASDEYYDTDNGYFDLLPEEVIQLILSFLDVMSLCRVARTCTLLYQHSYDSLQYTELNLQPHWTQVNDVALDSLQSRSRFLQRLNLSWCHENIVSATSFSRYMRACGGNLRCLYLSSCSFLKTESIKDIVTYCPNLTELDVSSCRQLDSWGLLDIQSLRQLEYLNLYRTVIDSLTILTIIRSCSELRFLNLGSCNCITKFDEILIKLGEHCRKLQSLDIWRSRTVSHIGINALADGCTELQELDIGWCPDIKSSNGCLVQLVQKCRKLKKLYLTANRTVCDADLLAIAKYSTDLEQLDILGTRQVSMEAAQQVLEKCEKMIFFDVSFCSGIDNYTVQQWTEQFPNVYLKKSFQN